jgi:hypothetical protein
VIYKDGAGFPVDQTGDGGDSNVRNCVLHLADRSLANPRWFYIDKDFNPCRHPTDEPWNNPKNFSRDQLTMLIAVSTFENKEFFRAALKRCFFAPNFERDWPGSTKYPWPHKVDGKWRWFDFADVLLPNHIGMMIVAGKIWPMYWFVPISYFFHILGMVLHKYSNHHEENQMLAECYVYGTLKFYTWLNPRWNEVSEKYWASRNEREYHDLWIQVIERECR